MTSSKQQMTPKCHFCHCWDFRGDNLPAGRRIPRMGGYRTPLYLFTSWKNERPRVSECLTVLTFAGGGGVGTAFAKGTAEARPLPVCLSPCQLVLQGLGRGEQTRRFSDGLWRPPTLFSLGGRGSHNSKSWPGGAGKEILEGRKAYVR